MVMGNQRRQAFLRWLPLLVGMAALLLYGVTTAPSIVELFDDTLEFQLIGPTVGIAHPTGYPLYVLLGGLVSRLLLPIGNWAWRMNILSAFFGAVTVGLLFATTRRLVTEQDGRPNQWAALAAAVAFGLGPVWWAQVTIAEVYALHLALMAAIIFAAIGINQLPPDRFDRRMTWLCLLAGLGLAHHRTTLLLAPPLAIYLLWSVPGLWRPRRVWWRWMAALLGPLLLYGWLPLRAATGVADLNGSYVNTWSGFWDHVLARQFGAFFADNPLAVERGPGDWLALFTSQMGGMALLLAGAGLLWLVDRTRRPAKAWIFILLVLLTNLVFALNYRVGDVEVFLLPVFYCLAIFIGGGVGLIPRVVGSRRPHLTTVAQLLLVLLLLSSWAGRNPFTGRRNEWATHNYAVAMANVAFPPGSQVVGLEGEMTALNYMQQAEGLGVEATLVVANDPAQRRAVIDAAVAAALPTFITRELAGLESLYSFTGEGPLVRVWPRGESVVPPPSNPLDMTLADGALRIEGYDLAVLDQPGNPAVALTIHWRPMAAVPQALKVSLRLADDAGNLLLQPDGTATVIDAFPLRHVALTTTWAPNTAVSDVHTVDLRASELARARQLEVIVYDAETVAEVARWQIDLAGFGRQ